MQLLVSLHDVTPFHLSRLLRVEAFFQEIGVRKATYLFVPNYHGSYDSAADSDFVAWCRSHRHFAVQWQLHGDRHLEALPHARDHVRPWTARCKRRLLTAGEGEFLALDANAQRSKLISGRAAFRHCLHDEPRGFVAPAWLFNEHLPPLLKELGFQRTEDHRRIYSLDKDRSLWSPVITWATRTTVLKYGSIAVASMLSRLWSVAAVLRVAIHPFDFDHTQTVASIRKVLEHAMRVRQQCFCDELDFGDDSSPGAALR
jgi:predicted deacetylase